MPAVSEAYLEARYRDECAQAGVLNEYNRMRREGTSPNLAAMFALKSPPPSRTDVEFLKDSANGRQFDNMGWYRRQHILNAAKQAGINISGKVYKAGLGRADNPLAWVSGKDDVLKSCQLQGKSCEGDVTYTPPEAPPPERVPIAPDLLNELIERRVEQDPGLKQKLKQPKKLAALKEELIDTHAIEPNKKG